MSIDEDTLNAVAQDGRMDYEKWPVIIEPLLNRLNYIVYHEFPTPRPYPTTNPAANRASSITDTPVYSSTTTQVTQTPTTPRQLPPVPPFPGSSTSDTSTSHVPDSQPDQAHAGSENDNSRPELSALLLQLLTSINSTLRTSFLTKPPHTIQRLSELILEPRKHYRTLPAWLRAVDRVVSVSSTADIFPLSDTPAIVNGVNGDGGGGILWNNASTDNRNGGSNTPDVKEKDGGLGSDESLGGALLTPIPWLRSLTHENINDDLGGSISAAGSEGHLSDDFLGGPIVVTTPTSETSSISAPDSADTLSTPVYSASETDSEALSAVPAGIHRNTDPLVPERPLGAVTQGELIRMEQEAGVVPIGPNGIPGSASPPTLHPGGLRSGGPPSSIALGIGVGLAGDPTRPREDREADPEHDVPLSDGPPHARGPNVVGTVDMGLVGGKGVEVTIGSPPSHDRTGMDKIDVNDAQEVLAGGNTAKRRDTDKGGAHSSSSSSDGFVHVMEGESVPDAMQVDNEARSGLVTHQQGRKPTADNNSGGADDDEDIVLVDADGLTEEQRGAVDASDLNVGNDTADGTGL